MYSYHIQSEHDNTAMHEMIAKTEKDNIMLRSEVLMLKSDLCRQALTQEALRDNPQKLKVYTGIVDWTVLIECVYMTPHVSDEN